MFYFSNKISVTTKFEQFCFKNFVVDIYSFLILISRQTTDKHRNLNFTNMSTYILRTKNSISLFFYTVQISYQYHKVQIPYLGLIYPTWVSDTTQGSATLPRVQIPYLVFSYPLRAEIPYLGVQILYLGFSYPLQGSDTLPRLQIPFLGFRYRILQFRYPTQGSVPYLGFRYSV